MKSKYKNKTKSAKIKTKLLSEDKAPKVPPYLSPPAPGVCYALTSGPYSCTDTDNILLWLYSCG